jgi:hypothetical protein
LAGPASSAELKIFGSRVTRMVVEDIGPQFTRATGHRLVVVTDVAAAAHSFSKQVFLSRTQSR